MADENADDVQYAGFSDRTAAFIIDAIIVGTLFLYLLEGVVPVGNFIGPLLFSGTATAFNTPEMPVIFGSAVAGLILLVLMCWLCSAGMTSSPYSATFGKMIMGMKVTDVLGDRLSFGHATIRFIAKIFSGLILFIGFFMIHYSDKKQGLHDRFAGTYVIYGKKKTPVPPDAGPTIARTLAEKDERRDEESRSNTKKILLLLGLPVILLAGMALLSLLFLGASAASHAHTYVVAATAQQPDASTIIVMYHGGPDAADLTSLDIVVNNNDPVRWDAPAVGEQKLFREGTAGKDQMVITGTFRNGDRQVILDTFL